MFLSRPMITALLLSLLFTACGDESNLSPMQEEIYTNSDGSLYRSDVNKFEGRKTLPRKCGDLPF